MTRAAAREISPEVNMSKRMNDFIGRVREIVKAGGAEEEVTARVAARLEPILDDPRLLSDEQLLVKREGFTLNRIHVEPDGSFSIGAGIWDMGQTTPIHDHGTWGVIGIYRGMESEESFLREGPRESGTRVRLTPRGRRLAGPGDVFVCCSTEDDAHRVSCASSEPVVGVHVYGGDLAGIPRFRYEEATGEARPFNTGWDYARTSAAS